MSLKPKRIDFVTTWSVLQETIKRVVTLSNIQKCTWNDRFSDVYNLCVAYPEPLGDRLYQETKTFLSNHVKVLFQAVCSQGEENLLTAYHSHWLEYSLGVDYLNKLYMYLNTQHIKKQKFTEADLNYGSMGEHEQMLEIGELGLDIWKKSMIEPIKDRLVTLLLECVLNDRCGRFPDKSVISGVIRSFVCVEEYKTKNSLELYEKVFESRFLEETGMFFEMEASKLLESCDSSLYMEKVIQKLADEDLRCNKFLHPSSIPKVMLVCHEKMVANHLQFFHSECKSMVGHERRKELRYMYTLLKTISNGLEILVKEVQSHIVNQGMEAITNLKSESVPAQFVENMLRVHQTSSDLIRDVFSNDQQFTSALDKACSRVINYRPATKQPCQSPELLAKYCDSLLKKSAKGMSESEIDDKLTSAITVFKYIDDKDVFQKFYSRTLAKRLIYGQSMSMDAEEAMINRLKQACGYEFTNKLHRMYTDMSVSTDLNNRFTEYLQNESVDLKIHFSIYVLQACAWPLGQSNLTPFAIPQELEKSVHMFETFYNTRYCGRKLTWVHHLCTAEMKLSYLKKPYLVSMGTFQMAILLQFESTNTVSFRDIQESTQLNPEQLNRNLQSLVETKLLTTASTGNFDAESLFNLNVSFSNKRTKFKINTVIQKESQQETEQTRNSVDEDRKLYLQAAIVRIMKARRLLRHNSLIEEVINQSKARFAPSISMIKKCVEALIDKQYIERTPNSTDEYSYIA
ncbi:Cullin-2 [Chamberlinius hualienensis]